MAQFNIFPKETHHNHALLSNFLYSKIIFQFDIKINKISKSKKYINFLGEIFYSRSKPLPDLNLLFNLRTSEI